MIMMHERLCSLKVLRVCTGIGVLLFGSGLDAYERLEPARFKVKLVQACQLLNLHLEPKRKSKKILTQVAYGDCVENLGCIREIAQRTLEKETNRTKRDFMAWKFPVWCRVETASGQRGWVLKEYLEDGCSKK
jgi:hypothetical protein